MAEVGHEPKGSQQANLVRFALSIADVEQASGQVGYGPIVLQKSVVSGAEVATTFKSKSSGRPHELR